MAYRGFSVADMKECQAGPHHSWVVFGTVVIAAIYGFLPESMRFSRAMIILGFMFALFEMIGIRLAIHFMKYKNLKLGEVREKN